MTIQRTALPLDCWQSSTPSTASVPPQVKAVHFSRRRASAPPSPTHSLSQAPPTLFRPPCPTQPLSLLLPPVPLPPSSSQHSSHPPSSTAAASSSFSEVRRATSVRASASCAFRRARFCWASCTVRVGEHCAPVHTYVCASAECAKARVSTALVLHGGAAYYAAHQATKVHVTKVHVTKVHIKQPRCT